MKWKCMCILGLSTMLLHGCTGMKYATEARPLFTDFNVEWEDPPEEARKYLTRVLEDVVDPKPNNTLLGMRPTVALHNAIKEPERPKGLGRLLKYKIGSEPVFLEDLALEDINAAFENRMNNRGYFSATSRYEVIHKKRNAKVVFTVYAGDPHRLRKVNYADSTDTLNKFIALSRWESPLLTDQLYDLETLDRERTRVSQGLRDKGWYHLTNDDLVFAADSSVADNRIDLLLRLKHDASTKVRQRYTLREVRVHGDHDELLPPNDTTLVDSVLYIDYLNNYRPSVITQGVFLKPGQFYSDERTEGTTRYLSSYGVFKSNRIPYTEDTVAKGILDADVILTPLKRWSLFTELNAVSKSNNFLGPGARVGFKDRDIFRGAEILNVDLTGRFETQVAGKGTGTNAYEIGAKVSLQIPRLVPFKSLRFKKSNAPSTRAEIGYGLFRRVGLYGLESFNTSFGYVWRQTSRIWHDAKPIDVSYTSLYFSSPEFDTFLDANPAVKRSFEEQFIIGLGYTFTIATKKYEQDDGYALFSIGFDEGGNLLSAIYSISGPRPEEGYRLFDRTFSQYVRFRPEIRYYGPIWRRGDRIAARLLVGAAKPYGNSDVVPYVKQFYVGGTNSIRAFRARSVGPGSYIPGENGSLLIDQVGDIRLEANLEYRFVLSGYFKGAVFADAGNVWLVNEDPQRPGGKFEWDNALSELAAGMGVGVRFDPEFIVVRLDLATPLRRPSLPAGDRWVFDDQRPRVLDNLLLNIAIGYPF